MITATVPDTSTGKITVKTPEGTAESATRFAISKVPEIRTFSPHSGTPGTIVTIKGKSFEGTTGVTLDGIPCVFKVKNRVQLRVTVPPGATSGKFIVTTGAGTSQSRKTFRVERSKVHVSRSGRHDSEE